MKTTKIILSLLISGLMLGGVNAADVQSLQAIDNATIKLTATPEVTFSDSKIYGDVKVLRDINVSFSARDFENSKKIVLNLSSDLYANTSYSLISIIGADGSIDFDIGEFLVGEIKNSAMSIGEKTIEKIIINDSRTMEVYFTYDLKEDDFEFKILSELSVEELSSMGDNILTINMKNTLDKSTTYIVMVIELEDIDGNKVNFTESLYDVITSSNLTKKQENDTLVKAKEEEPDAGNIEEIALNSAETPDTGAETWVLFMLTFIFSTFYFVRNKFAK